MSMLRRFREAAGLSREELAERAGITSRTIAGIELGTTKPSIETLLRLRKALSDAAVLALLDELESQLDRENKQKAGRPGKND